MNSVANGKVYRNKPFFAILATSGAVKADELVTGDGDLLALSGKYPIQTPAEFVRRL